MRSLLLSLAFVSASASASAQSAPSSSPISPCGFTQEKASSTFTLQVAAAGTLEDAKTIADEIPGAWIAKACVKGRPVFRVNFGRFHTRVEAMAAQWRLEEVAPHKKGLVVRV